MPEKLFLYDNKLLRSYAYNQLLTDLSNEQEVSEYCCTRDLYSTFLKILSAILHNVNLVLLDSDFSELELNNLNLDSNDILKTKPVQKLSLDTVDVLIQRLKENSDWELTLFTSGTTGIPKRVVHKFSALTRAVRISEKHSEDIWGFAYNPTHIAGLQVFFQALLNGNTLINLFEASRDDILKLIVDYNITNISATPTFFRLLLPLYETFSTVKKLTSGGEKFDPKLTDSMLKAFPNARIRNVYASTEAGTILESRDDTFSILDVSLCKIIDKELYIHRSLLGKGKELGEDSEDWYATGDMVDIIETNPLSFRFLQRKNEMINVGGYKVNPYEVEQLLQTHPSVKQAFIYGKTNPVLGNILMADIVTQQETTEREIREFLAPMLQPYKIPRVINFVESIELTRTGKLKRN